MSGQSQIRIKTGNALDTGATTSNVATNKAELEALAAANVDGKDTYPQSVSTQRLQVAQTLSIGDQVQMTDGCVSAEHLASGSVTTEKLNCTDVTTSNISFSGGSLSEFGVSTLGSITGGSLSVGSGGVTISADGGTSGVYIGGNVISCIYGGLPTFHVDGTTGIVTATKFQMTADGDSSLDMTAGSLTIGSTTAVDDGGAGYTVADIYSNAAQAISDAATAQGTADGKVTTFYQDNAPTAEATGDLWVDTNDSNKLYRWSGSSWLSVRDSGIAQAISDAADAQSTADGKIVTFYQASAPSGASVGDLWVETDNNNKLWRYSGSSWQSAQDAGAAAGATALQPGDAIAPGGGVEADSSGYITKIRTSSGIVITSASSSYYDNKQRTQITSDGMAIYNSSNKLIVQADHSNGVYINNPVSTDPDPDERLSLAYGGTEKSWIGCYSSGATGWISLANTITIHGYELDVYSAGNIDLVADTAVVVDDNLKIVSGGTVTFEAGSVDPQILAGSPTSFSISEGASASGYALGTIFLGTGGSIWTVYYDSGDRRNEWTRIYTGNYHPA